GCRKWNRRRWRKRNLQRAVISIRIQAQHIRQAGRQIGDPSGRDIRPPIHWMRLHWRLSLGRYLYYRVSEEVSRGRRIDPTTRQILRARVEALRQPGRSWRLRRQKNATRCHLKIRSVVECETLARPHSCVVGTAECRDFTAYG